MSDFTFTTPEDLAPHIAHWANTVAPASTFSSVSPVSPAGVGPVPRQRVPLPPAPLSAIYVPPPPPRQRGERRPVAGSDIGATRRAQHAPLTAAPRRATSVAPLGGTGGVGQQRLARPLLPTPSRSSLDRPVSPSVARPADHQSRERTRDGNAATRRGFVSSEPGNTDVDDPVPPYPGTPTQSLRELLRPAEEDSPPPQQPQMSGALPDPSPEDSISSAGSRRHRHRRHSISRSSTGDDTTSSTVSLTDSSVERICERLQQSGIGGAQSRRRRLDTVPEEAATSAAHRRSHIGPRVQPGPETLRAGARLLLGAQEVRKDVRGNLVLVRKKR